MNIRSGSGTFVGIAALTNSLPALGWQVDLITPKTHFPIYTAERVWFNESLVRSPQLGTGDVTVGFDLDGYAWARNSRRIPHVASIKGVIADEMQYEKGFTYATMRMQAHLEAKHVRRARYVITTSAYAAEMLKRYYGITRVHSIIPELIDLDGWTRAIQQTFILPHPDKFIVLCVSRFYPRKRLGLLLDVAEVLRYRLPALEIRLIGGGPEDKRLQSLCRKKRLSNIVFRRDISQSDLVSEYLECDVFCLPSVQEGFGIVFLEAMACAKPIVAIRAAAVPEVVKHGILTEPESVEGLANAIETLHANPSMRADLGAAGKQFVQNFDAHRIAKIFSMELSAIVASVRM